MSAWSSASTLIPIRPDARTRPIIPPRLSSARSTMGGVIDSDANAETVVPVGTPSTEVVTTVTGAATRAMASRKELCRSSTAPTLSPRGNCGRGASRGQRAESSSSST